MKTLSRTLTTCTAAAALLLATIGVAQAYVPDAPTNDVAEAIAAVAPDAGDTLAPSMTGDTFAARTDATTTLVPADPSAPVTLTSTDHALPDAKVTLPDLAGTDDARQAADGTLVFTSDDDASLAVQPLADGSTRFLSVLDSKNAPERYDYTFDGLTLGLQDDGSVVALDGDAPTGFIAAPWATDSDGTAVPTHYEVNGSVLTQVVEHTSGDFAFPLTADPKYTPSWWNFTIHFNRSKTRKVAGGMSAPSIIAPIAGAVTGPVGAYISAVSAANGALLRKYYDDGKCAKMVFYGAIGVGMFYLLPQPYSGREAGGYCR